MQIGRISSIDYAAGMARVTYPDRGGAVTPPLPMLAEQYHMPQVGDLVLVADLSNGAQGVILGKFWTQKNVPVEGREQLYRHDLGQLSGQATVTYDGATKTLTLATDGTLQLVANSIGFRTPDGSGPSMGLQGDTLLLSAPGTVQINGAAVQAAAASIRLDGGAVQASGESVTLAGSTVQANGESVALTGKVTINGQVISP